MMDYLDFIKSKTHFSQEHGFPVPASEISSQLWRHQPDIVRWALLKGRAAIFASFGLGKTRMQCEILRQIYQREAGRHLIICPLGVRQEFFREGSPMSCAFTFARKTEEVEAPGLYLTNYESVRDGKLDVNLFTAWPNIRRRRCLI